MTQVLYLQKQILTELDNIVDIDKKETMADKISGKKQHIFINSSHLEDIEKYYFMLDKINRNTYSLLDKAKIQKDKLHTYSDNIRKHLKKENPIKNDNKFINVLDSHFNGGHDIKFNPEQHREMYDSIQRYHQLNSYICDSNYILLKSVNIVNNYCIDIPVADTLNSIPCMFNWYNGDSKHEAGIYIAISHDFIVKIPFPDLICKNSKNFKHKSMPCKYKTAEYCGAKQLESSKYYKTEVRQCNFVHIGESFIKIGSDFRAPNLPSFGAFNTLQQDLGAVNLSDIKTILMNSCSDLLLLKLWQLQHTNLGELIFTNLDKLLM